MEPDQPPVTIVNPAAGDVLIQGSEKPPWHPTRRQTRMTAAILATVTAVVSTVWLVTDTVLDRAANADVRIQTGVGPEFGPSLGVVSVGRRPVELVSVRLDGPGYREIEAGTLLVHGVARTVGLPSGTTCPEDPFAPVPHEVVLTLRTERGTVVRRTVELDEGLAHRVEERERGRCGIPPLESTVEVRLLSARVVGEAVEASYELWNTAIIPITLADWRAAPGLSLVTTPAAFELTQGQSPYLGGDPHTTTVRVRVNDCEGWEERLEPDGLVSLGDGVEVPLTVATATRQDGAYELRLGVQLVTDQQSVVDYDLMNALRVHCGLRSF